MYDEALHYAPTDSTLLLSRSFAHTMTTPPRLDLALKDADSAIQYAPTDWQAWLQKGETRLKMGDLQAAEEALVNAVGFAQGINKLTAQRSLGDVRARKAMPAPSSTRTAPSSSAPDSQVTQAPSASSPATPAPKLTSSLTSKPQPRRPPSAPAIRPTTVTQIPNTTTPNIARTTSSSAAPIASNTQPAPAKAFEQKSRNVWKSLYSSPSSSTQPTSGSATSTNSSSKFGPLNSFSANSSSSTNPTTGTQPTHLLGNPADAPPGYTPSLNNADPAVRALSQQALQVQLTELQNKLKISNKGALSIRPYTAAGNIDCLRLFYLGMTQLELTARELSTPVYLHPIFNYMHITAASYPGSTWLNIDCETSAYYEGKLPGTVSIGGYSEEYREHQLLIAPLLQLSLESATTLPVIPLNQIVQRLQTLQRNPTSEDNEGLRGFLGLSQLIALQSGFSTNRQRQIEYICMGLNRSLYDAPTRFVDFSKARNISNNTLGTVGQGISLHHFLYQILLGAELLVRLRKEPITISYAGVVTDPLSALIVLSSLWMANVTITAVPVTTTLTTALIPAPNYTLYAVNSQQQIQGLIRFAEALSWPLMGEARAYIENSYRALIVNPTSVGFDMCDWLFGLILPGRIFRHRIMSCLVFASPTIRNINSAPYWDNGLIVKNKSYWPKSTVLGRVLGGLRNPKSVCGWLGPVPAPEGWTETGWVKLNSRRVDIPVPISTTGQDTLESLGFGSSEANEDPEALIHSIVDPNEWIPSPGPPPRRASDTSRTQFKGFRLTQLAGTATAALGSLPTIEYRASVDFDINGKLGTYVLYSNPVFVSAPPCVGTHLINRRRANKYLSADNVIKVADLKEAYPEADKLVIIDAQGASEEVVARAWCAERARHAVIRRGPDCCFSCAVAVATRRTGLGVNVLIWSI
ncbi:hypothetical protein B0O99DRAFT_582254 [Bisporella sp. PMI_857]|nr:hypothetical protein B0O99DRAFT_582254 [Bisporella sp. PMI_857]